MHSLCNYSECQITCENCLSTFVDTDSYRTVIIPTDISSQFEQVASPNTRKNIETCGILAGKLVRVANFVCSKC